jgi:hypothetical protein
MNSNIFNIQSDYLKIVDELEQNGGELTPELEKALLINQEERDAKMIAYVHVIKQYQADNSLIKDEIVRLREKMESNDKVVTRLKKVLMEAMERFGLHGKSGNLSHKIDSYTLFTRGTESVEIVKEELDRDDEITFADLTLVALQLEGIDYNAILDIISDISGDLYDILINNHKTTISKTKFKTAYHNTISNYEEEDTNKEKLQILSNIGKVVENQSLTIK